MLKTWQFWLLNVLAGVTLVLVTVNVILSMDNRAIQREVAKQQAFINQSISLSRLNTQLIRALAMAASQRGDTEIGDLLATHGVTFQVNENTETPQ